MDGLENNANELTRTRIASLLGHSIEIYTKGGTVNRFANLSRLETAVSEHGCVADTDLGGFLIDSHYYYTECFS